MKYLFLTDSNDSKLGDYFDLSSKNIFDSFPELSTQFVNLSGSRLSNISLDLLLEQNENKIHLLVSYCHGFSEGLCFNEGQVLIDVGHGLIKKFGGTIVYLMSCSAGKVFGPRIIEEGAECFIGYKDELIIILDYQKEFTRCMNAGIIQLFSGSTAQVAYMAIKHQFNRFLIHLPFFEQAIINDNNDKLALLGNPMAVLEVET